MKPTLLKKIARMMGISAEKDLLVSGFAVDSRLVSHGDLFFALPGDKTDGHLFLSAAAAQGAVAAVVLENYQGETFGMPLLRCRDTLDALHLLTKVYLSSVKSKVVAISGSLGKTTTKEFLTAILKKKYSVAFSSGNNNSKIGLPLAILNNANSDEDYLVLEMGMTHTGDLRRLIDIAPPHLALITSIALVHAWNFDAIEDIARAKAELFTHPKTAISIYPLDYDFGSILSAAGSCAKMSFSVQSPQADYYLENQEEGMLARPPIGSAVHLPSLKLPGDHNRHNFLAAAAAAHCLGMTWEEIGETVHSLVLYERRLQICEKNGAIFVNDSYNAAELSLKSALRAMPQPANGGKKIAVIGEMTELGKFSSQCHQEVGEYALKYVDSMLCLGQGCGPIVEVWQKAQRPVYWSLDRAAVVAALRSQLKPGDVVLLKGSRPNCLWKVLEELY